MTKDAIEIQVEERETVRKGLNALREDGVVPAVIHDHGKPSILVQADALMLTKTVGAAGGNHTVTLKLGGKTYLTLIKDVDFSPAKNRLRHVVFQAIGKNETVTAEVPVVFKEDVEIPAERKGLLVLRQTDMVEVEALPQNLPNEFVIDPSVLENEGDRLHVSDIKVPTGVTITTDPEMSLVVVEVPRDQLAEADAAAAELAEDAETPTEVPTTNQEEDIVTDESPDSEELKDESKNS